MCALCVRGPVHGSHVCPRPSPRQPRVCTTLSTAAAPRGIPESSTGDGQRRTRAAGFGRPKDAASLPAARVHLRVRRWSGESEEDSSRGGSLTWNLTKQMSKGKETKNQTLKPREGADGPQRGGGGRRTGGRQDGGEEHRGRAGCGQTPDGGSRHRAPATERACRSAPRD